MLPRLALCSILAALLVASCAPRSAPTPAGDSGAVRNEQIAPLDKLTLTSRDEGLTIAMSCYPGGLLLYAVDIDPTILVPKRHKQRDFYTGTMEFLSAKADSRLLNVILAQIGIGVREERIRQRTVEVVRAEGKYTYFIGVTGDRPLPPEEQVGYAPSLPALQQQLLVRLSRSERTTLTLGGAAGQQGRSFTFDTADYRAALTDFSKVCSQALPRSKARTGARRTAGLRANASPQRSGRPPPSISLAASAALA